MVPNGSGKTTFLDAVVFALFGKPYRNINIPQLVNSVNQKECLVEINFDIGGSEYRVVRGLAPKILKSLKIIFLSIKIPKQKTTKECLKRTS